MMFRLLKGTSCIPKSIPCIQHILPVIQTAAAGQVLHSLAQSFPAAFQIATVLAVVRQLSTVILPALGVTVGRSHPLRRIIAAIAVT